MFAPGQQPNVVNHINPYVSQHVPLPLEEMENALQRKEYKAAQVLAQGEATKTQLAGIEGSGMWAQNYLNETKAKMDEHLGKFVNSDLTDPEVGRQFREIASEIGNDQNLRKIQDATGKIKVFSTRMKELQNSGKYREENAYLGKRAIQYYSATGELPDWFDGNVPEAVNEQTALEEYYKPLHESGGESAAALFGTDGEKTWYKNGQFGISADKYASRTAHIFNDFLADPAGQQMVRRKMMQNGGDRVEAMKSVYKDLIQYGDDAAYSKTTTSIHEARNKVAEKKDKNAFVRTTLGMRASDVPDVAWDKNTDMPVKDASGLQAAYGTAESKFNELREKGVNPLSAAFKAARAGYNASKEGAYSDKTGALASNIFAQQSASNLVIDQLNAEMGKKTGEAGAIPSVKRKDIYDRLTTRTNFEVNQSVHPETQNALSRGIIGEAGLGPWLAWTWVDNNTGEQLPGSDIYKGINPDLLKTGKGITFVGTPSGTVNADGMHSVGIVVETEDGPKIYSSQMGGKLPEEAAVPQTYEDAQRINAFVNNRAVSTGLTTGRIWEKQDDGSLNPVSVRVLHTPNLKGVERTVKIGKTIAIIHDGFVYIPE